MMSGDKTKVLLMVGTRKGGFILTSDRQRKKWHLGNPLFKGWSVMHLILDPRDRRIHAGVVHDIFGPSTHYSDDLGTEWTQSLESPTFTRPSRSGRPLASSGEPSAPQEVQSNPEKVNKVWHIKPAGKDQPGVLYAGIQPAALFKSTNYKELL